jgi:hypothetical protein
MLAFFSLTLFCSAALLFLVEPLVGKLMLPLLGGTPAVWNTCMVFFQAVLLAGYGYAHVSSHYLGARRQAALHLGVLLLPVPLLFFVFNGPRSILADLIAGREGNPIPALLLALTVLVGLPMFVVCSSAPLLQKWFSSTDHPAAKDPYFLYGASNLGSMLALLAYPTLVEPNFSLDGQRLYWSIGFVLLAGLTAGCALLLWLSRPGPELTLPAAGDEAGPQEAPVTLGRRLTWVALCFVPSSLMLGATAYMTTDLAPIPGLWVLPLALYLLSFVLVFARIGPFGQALIGSLLLLALFGAAGWWGAPLILKEDATLTLLWVRWGCMAAWVLLTAGLFLRATFSRDRHLIHKSMVGVMPFLVLLVAFLMLSGIKPVLLDNLMLHLVTLFVVCMVCHGALARDRPSPPYLTGYFLLLSAGGVLGGLFNALVAPLVFNATAEYPLALACACLLLPPLLAWRSGNLWSVARWGLAALSLALVVGLTYVGANAFEWHRADLRAEVKRCQKDVEDLKKSNRAAPGYAKNLDKAEQELAEAQRGDWERIQTGPWGWALACLGLAGALAVLGCLADFAAPPPGDGQPQPNAFDRTLQVVNRLLDVTMPLAVVVLSVGLYWGLGSTAKPHQDAVEALVEAFDWSTRQARTVLAYGAPACLCLFFVNRPLRFGLSVGALLLAGAYSARVGDPPLYQGRSFFGVLKVEEREDDDPFEEGERVKVRRLLHGTTLHGIQYMSGEMRYVPTTYYHRTGPVGWVFREYNAIDRPFAVIGLGTGTMACYGLAEPKLDNDGEAVRDGNGRVVTRRAQKLTFYDIDPVVIGLSGPNGRYFKHVDDAIERGVRIDVVLGDARLTLARQQLAEEDKYSLLVVDAFSSDAIPVHLITREALLMYFTKMRQDGIVLFHISNRYLNLEPVLANLVEKEGLAAYHMSDNDESFVGKSASSWVAVARQKAHLQKLVDREASIRRQVARCARSQKGVLPLMQMPNPGGGVGGLGLALYGTFEKMTPRAVPDWGPTTPQPDLGVWTDDYSNVLSVCDPYTRWRDRWRKRIDGWRGRGQPEEKD